MKRPLLATIALAALIAGPAMAADMRVKAPAAPPPVWNWTGCYIGGHIGVLFVQKEFVDRTPDGEFFGLSRGDHDVHGLLGGVQGGCDFQFAGGFVVGIQGDYAWTDAGGSHIIDPLVGDATIQTKIKSLATVTGRIGYSWDRLLGYVKGGGAWERDNYDVFEPTTLVALALASETRSGWTIGIGGEYAFSNFISGFLEYNYYDFGNRDITFVTPSGETLHTLDIKETKSVVRAGVNLRFGGGKAPVAARY